MFLIHLAGILDKENVLWRNDTILCLDNAKWHSSSS